MITWRIVWQGIAMIVAGQIAMQLSVRHSGTTPTKPMEISIWWKYLAYGGGFAAILGLHLMCCGIRIVRGKKEPKTDWAATLFFWWLTWALALSSVFFVYLPLVKSHLRSSGQYDFIESLALIAIMGLALIWRAIVIVTRMRFERAAEPRSAKQSKP